MGYAFRSDIYWCVANGRMVLLDLKADRYLALPNDVDDAVQDWLGGAPAAPAAFAALSDMGVVMESARAGPPVALSAPHPTSDFTRPSSTGFGVERLEAWFVQLRVKEALRHRPLFDIVGDIRQRKAVHTSPKCPKGQPMPTEATRQYIASRRIISAQDECLRWSVAMVTYLARRQYFPDLVLGVRMMPFAAHAWVQDGSVVLSDTAEYVSAYTPILVV
jgi:hypothetical protein